MNKKNFGLLIVIAGLLLYGIDAYAAGDLIVDGQLSVSGQTNLGQVSVSGQTNLGGQLTVSGQTTVRSLPTGCSGIANVVLTTNAICYTLTCGYVNETEYYWNCDASGCVIPDSPAQCSTTYVGKVYP